MNKKNYSAKIKKLLQNWGAIFLIMLICAFILQNITVDFIIFFALLFALVGLAVIFDWE